MTEQCTRVLIWPLMGITRRSTRFSSTTGGGGVRLHVETRLASVAAIKKGVIVEGLAQDNRPRGIPERGGSPVEDSSKAVISTPTGSRRGPRGRGAIGASSRGWRKVFHFPDYPAGPDRGSRRRGGTGPRPSLRVHFLPGRRGTRRIISPILKNPWLSEGGGPTGIVGHTNSEGFDEGQGVLVYFHTQDIGGTTGLGGLLRLIAGRAQLRFLFRGLEFSGLQWGDGGDRVFRRSSGRFSAIRGRGITSAGPHGAPTPRAGDAGGRFDHKGQAPRSRPQKTTSPKEKPFACS